MRPEQYTNTKAIGTYSTGGSHGVPHAACSLCSLVRIASTFPTFQQPPFPLTNTSQEQSISTRSFSSNQELCFKTKRPLGRYLGKSHLRESTVERRKEKEQDPQPVVGQTCSKRGDLRAGPYPPAPAEAHSAVTGTGGPRAGKQSALS